MSRLLRCHRNKEKSHPAELIHPSRDPHQRNHDSRHHKNINPPRKVKVSLLIRKQINQVFHNPKILINNVPSVAIPSQQKKVAVAGLEPATSCFLHLPLKGRALPTELHGIPSFRMLRCHRNPQKVAAGGLEPPSSAGPQKLKLSQLSYTA